MATDNTFYFRRYLVDPDNIQGATMQQAAEIDPNDINVPYYRRYLDDPIKIQSGGS